MYIYYNNFYFFKKMGDKIWFATVDWNGYGLADNPIPSCYKHAEWNAKHSSPFTGFPFPGTFGSVYKFDESAKAQCPYHQYFYGQSNDDILLRVANGTFEKVKKQDVLCRDDEMKVWDGTYFEKKDTKNTHCDLSRGDGGKGGGDPWPNSSFDLEVSYDIKYPSSKKDLITPVCGSGTPIIKIKRQTLAEWIWRIKYLDIESCDISWNESLNWSGSGGHGTIPSDGNDPNYPKYEGNCNSDGSVTAYLNLNGSFTKKNADSTKKDNSQPEKKERDILKNKHPEYTYSEYPMPEGYKDCQGFVSYNKITGDYYKNDQTPKYEPEPIENLTVDTDMCISVCGETKCKDDNLERKYCGDDSYFPWPIPFGYYGYYGYYNLMPIGVPEKDFSSVCMVKPLTYERGLNCFFINDPTDDPYNKYVYVDVRGLIEFRIQGWLHDAWIGFAEVTSVTQKITNASDPWKNATLREVNRYQYTTLSIDFFGKETVDDIPIIIRSNKQSSPVPFCCAKTCCEWEYPSEENNLKDPQCKKEEDAPRSVIGNYLIEPTLNFSISGGKLVLKGKEYWEYGNEEGSPIYNKDTGEKILDPITGVKVKA
jgi:hypothetical protein